MTNGTSQSQPANLQETGEFLRQLAISLKAVAATNPPNWKFPLAKYLDPNWPALIGAIAIAHDDQGPTLVVWQGHQYLRRCGSSRKLGTAIWFSRPNGGDGEGNAKFVRLCTFSDKDSRQAEPLPEYVKTELSKIKRQQR